MNSKAGIPESAAHEAAAQLLARLRRAGLERYLLAVAGLLALLLAVQGVRYVYAGRLGRGLAESLHAGPGDPVKPDQTKRLEDFNLIGENGFLGSPPSKKAPPQRLFGIMGDTALLGTEGKNAKPFKVGAAIPGGERIVEILIDRVVLEKEGKKRTVCVFPEIKTEGGPAPGGPSPAVPRATPGPAASQPERGPAGSSPMRSS